MPVDRWPIIFVKINKPSTAYTCRVSNIAFYSYEKTSGELTFGRGETALSWGKMTLRWGETT